jgi:hypothetical protein
VIGQERTCAECGQPFIVKQIKASYCGRTCKRLGGERKRREKLGLRPPKPKKVATAGLTVDEVAFSIRRNTASKFLNGDTDIDGIELLAFIVDPTPDALRASLAQAQEAIVRNAEEAA